MCVDVQYMCVCVRVDVQYICVCVCVNVQYVWMCSMCVVSFERKLIFFLKLWYINPYENRPL